MLLCDSVCLYDTDERLNYKEGAECRRQYVVLVTFDN